MKPKLFLVVAGGVTVVAVAIVLNVSSAKPAAPRPLATAPALLGPWPTAASGLIMVPPARPEVNTNGVVLPKETPYDHNPEAKEYYLSTYCEGYRHAVANPQWGFTTRCRFDNKPLTENEKAEDAGWVAGQAAANATKQLVKFVGSEETNGVTIIKFQ